MSTRNTVNNPPAQPSVATVADLWNAAGSPNTAPELQVGDTCFVAGTINALYVCTSAGVGTATWILGGNPTFAALATVSTASATLTSAHETAITYAAGTCALTLPADVTVWPVGVTKRVRKQNTSTNPITLAPNAGGTVNGLGVGVALTLPGSQRPSATARADMWWDITRAATNTWTVAGGNPQFNTSGNLAIDGAATAYAFGADFAGSAAAPSLRPGPDTDSGYYYDATKGIVGAVDGVDRSQLKTDGSAWLLSGLATASLGIAATGGNAIILVRSGTPEGASSAGPGSICVDYTNGKLYLKVTGTGNTGWREVSPSVSGTWTPTISATVNLDSASWVNGRYVRVGDFVICGGAITIDPTATGTVSYELTPPIATNFSTAYQCSGICIRDQTDPGRVLSNATNDTLAISLFSNSTAASVSSLICIYQVI